MAQKATKKINLNIKGVLDIDDDGKIIVEIEDRDEFDLATMMNEFYGRECSISVSYDEDYMDPEVDVDPETGEVFKHIGWLE